MLFWVYSMGRLANAKAIHIRNSHEPTPDQKLQKSMPFQHTERQAGKTKCRVQRL